jgi:hypothetical protein
MYLERLWAPFWVINLLCEPDASFHTHKGYISIPGLANGNEATWIMVYHGRRPIGDGLDVMMSLRRTTDFSSLEHIRGQYRCARAVLSLF